MAAPRRRATGWRQLRRAAVVAAVLTGLAPLVARPSFAAATVPPGFVSVVSDPGAGLVVPADGRLRGDHLAAIVTGVAWAAHVGLGASARQAVKGQELLAFGLQGAHIGQTDDGVGNTIPPVTAALIVDGQRSSLPAPGRDDGSAPVYYMASVPSTARDVEVELAAAGLAQQFSLTAGARVGPQPVVLYRDRISWKPTDQVNAEQVLATPDPTDALPGATLPIRIHDVYMAWFGPDSAANVPTSPNRAWLVVDATSQDDSQVGTRYLHYLSGLSAAQVTLSMPGGQTVTSQLLNPGSGETGVGVFDGIYDFSVPANMTSATLTVGPADFQVTMAFSGSTPVTVATHGQASFPITFPAPYQPRPQLPRRARTPGRLPPHHRQPAPAVAVSARKSRLPLSRSCWPARRWPWLAGTAPTSKRRQPAKPHPPSPTSPRRSSSQAGPPPPGPQGHR